MIAVDPDRRPPKIASARLVALIKLEIDACSREDTDDLLADLFWTAWPTVWSQDQ
jgi:hypothetical protein